MFDEKIVIDEIPEETSDHPVKINKRRAVRAICFYSGDNRILMEQTRLGDYKLPGGGIEQGESHQTALLRELREETGYRDILTGPCIGKVTECSRDSYEEHAWFEMTSYYYICMLNSEEKETPKLDVYGEQLNFHPVWVSLQDALNHNRNLTEHKDRETLFAEVPWLERETKILEYMEKSLILPMLMEVWNAGRMLLGADRSHMEVDAKEGRANFVTEYDRRVQEHLKERLGIRLKEAVFVGEEEELHACVDKGLALITDPIDGTTNFMKDYHLSCISVGLTMDGEAYGGIILNPYLGELYYAERGMGAWCNGNRLAVSDKPLKDGIVLFGTSPYRPDLTDVSFRLARTYFEQALDIRRSGSAAWDLCCIAAGRAELYFECILQPWDYAAGSLIVSEAGGRVTTLEGEPVRYDCACSVLACGSAVKNV